MIQNLILQGLQGHKHPKLWPDFPNCPSGSSGAIDYHEKITEVFGHLERSNPSHGVRTLAARLRKPPHQFALPRFRKREGFFLVAVASVAVMDGCRPFQKFLYPTWPTSQVLLIYAE